MRWHRSSHSQDSALCVEFALLSPTEVGVRDSKNPSGPVLVYSTKSWRNFIAAVCADKFSANLSHDKEA
jgi:hypothetical protein